MRTNSSRGLQDIRVTRHTVVVVVFFLKERSWSWWRKRWLTAIHTATSRSEVTRRRGGTGRRFRDRKSQARPEWPRWRSGPGNIRQLAAGHRHHWTTSFKLDFLPLRISLFHRHSFRPCFLCPYYFFSLFTFLSFWHLGKPCKIKVRTTANDSPCPQLLPQLQRSPSLQLVHISTFLFPPLL